MDDLKGMAYRRIKEMIISCELRPGQLIDQNKLIEDLGVSRTPVRDALNELDNERLVEIYPRRGVFVSALSPLDMKKIYAVRTVMEPYIVSLVTPTASRDRLNEFLSIFSSQENITNHRTFCQSDYDFHMFLAQATENEYIINLMENVLSHNMRFVIIASELPRRLERSNLEHAKIIEAILEGDVTKASRQMASHIKKAMTSCVSTLNGSLIIPERDV